MFTLSILKPTETAYQRVKKVIGQIRPFWGYRQISRSGRVAFEIEVQKTEMPTQLFSHQTVLESNYQARLMTAMLLIKCAEAVPQNGLVCPKTLFTRYSAIVRTYT